MATTSGSDSRPGWQWWSVWLTISVAWLWFVGLLGGLIASGGLNASGAEPPQRLLGSALVGTALAGPVLLSLTHRFTWPHARRVLVAAIAAAVVGALATYRYSS